MNITRGAKTPLYVENTKKKKKNLSNLLNQIVKGGFLSVSIFSRHTFPCGLFAVKR